MSSTTWVAVADLHGQLELFRKLLAYLDQELGDDYHLCTVGDYVDNGTDVPALLDFLIELKRKRGDRFVAILGNHDLALLRSLGWPGRVVGERWYERWSSRYWNRGLGTPQLYAVKDSDPPRSAKEFATIFPDAHRAFLASLPWCHDTGEYLFVHAGMKPGPLAPQVRKLEERELSSDDWSHLPAQLRDKKLATAVDASWERTVVSGHTRLPGGRFEGAQRICISAEVDSTGVLRAVVLPERRWLAIDDGEGLRVG